MSRGANSGPIFVVGLSRSGTKLLRDILNRHPEIRIPTRESYFIPYTLTHIGNCESPPDKASRGRFIRHLQGSVFYRNMNEQAVSLSHGELVKLVNRGQSWPEIIESVFRYYTGPENTPFIWGDKTPKYLKHMLLLRDNFADARFLHIYRDPRDRVLSANKAWGANIYISAEQWREGMQEALRQAPALGSAYKSVCYESLVSRPEEVVGGVCDFLGLSYHPRMLQLDSPVERRGDMTHATRQSAEIVATNQQKYIGELTPRQLARIERIVFPLAGELGYQAHNPSLQHRPLGKLEKLSFTLPHTFHTLRLLTRRWGTVRGLRYAFARWRL
jgi:hypothetical protein